MSFILQSDMSRSMFSFLTQSELLAADTCCRSWRTIISAPAFWVNRKLNASRPMFKSFAPKIECQLWLVLAQPRFSSCRAVDLSHHYLGDHEDLAVLRYLFRVMSDLEEVQLKNVFVSDGQDKFGTSPYLEECLGELGGSRLHTLVIPSVSVDVFFRDYAIAGAVPRKLQVLSQRFPNLVSLTLDGGYAADLADDHDYGVDDFGPVFPSLLHVRLENNRVLRCSGLRRLFARCPQLRSLTLVNWLTPFPGGIQHKEMDILSLWPYCPASLDVFVVLESVCLNADPPPGDEETIYLRAPGCPADLEVFVPDVMLSKCLDEFWRRVRAYRLRLPIRKRERETEKERERERE